MVSGRAAALSRETGQGIERGKCLLGTARRQRILRGWSAPTAGEADETAVLRVLDRSGTELARQNAFVLLDTEREAGADMTGIVDVLIERPTNAASIELLVNGVVADTFVAGSSVSGAAIAANAQVEAMVSGDGTTANISVSNLGAAPEGITYNVEISTDGGVTWQVVALCAAAGSDD